VGELAVDSRLLAVTGDRARDREYASPVRAGAVPPLADGFSTRPETGAGLAETLEPGQIMALTGPEVRAPQLYDWPGGTGKTQLAVYLAESLWQARQVDLLLWVTAASRASVLASYMQAFAEITGTDPAGDAETVAARLIGWLAQTSQRWLVVLDDVTASADLAGLWPEGPAGRVLVTTRSIAALTGAAKPLVCPVGAFSSHEALTYLMGRLSADPDQRVGAVDLLDDLGREPLALAQASATIASSGLSCRDYRELFARRRERIADAVGGRPAAKAVTWTLSVEQADQLSPARLAQSCLAFAVLLDCHGIPGEVFSTAAACEYIMANGPGGAPDQKGVRGALLSLERAGLLTVDATSNARTVRVHPVVQAAVRSATPEPMRDQAAQAAARALLQAWPADRAQPWVADALRSCATSLQQAAADALWAGGAHAVLFQAGQSMDSARLRGPAVAHWRAVAAASERVLGSGHQETLQATARLGSALLAAGQGATAVALSQRTVDARAHALGPGHPGTLAAQADLGSALLAAGQPRDAIIALEGILAATERGPVPDGLDLPAVQDALAAAYLQAGRHPDAIRLARRIVEEQERRHGNDHPGTMSARANLASACLSGGRLKEAIVHAKQALADRERVLGQDHPDTLASLSLLATANHSARRYKDALPLFERALRDRERVQGRDHPDTLGAQGNLASAYHSAGRMASALPLYERSRTDCQRVLGAHHPDTLAARANLAQAYYTVGRLTDAVALLRGVAADCERELPPGHPLTKAVRESLQAIADD
jgi:tetratricopeptide (TPR) repeat protein